MIIEALLEPDHDEDDAEHGDIWLSERSSGWAIGVFAGARGLVVLENTEPGGEAFHRTDVSRHDTFTLLRRVADGHLDAIRAESWHPGYGSD
ncbi:hypothetical protein [Micromonospora sp. IBHARD004]|uniref:hypothetical protein n=1 Tax=Micromonospora sp. IBHARD004 TaxID=3457764 RepID=UPI0040594192